MMAGSQAETLVETAEADDGKAGLNLGKLETSIGFVLRIAQLTAFERFFSLFTLDEIRISEFTVLLAVHMNPGVRQGVLADVLRIKWSNMTKLVRALETRDWIRRRIPPNDRRSVELYVTDAGIARIEASAADMYQSDHGALAMLDDGERQTLLRLLHKVAGWAPRKPGA